MIDKERLEEIKELLDSPEAKAIEEYYKNEGHDYQTLSILFPDENNKPQLKILHAGEAVSMEELKRFSNVAKDFYKNATEESIMQTLYMLTNRNLAIYLSVIKTYYTALTNTLIAGDGWVETTEMATGRKFKYNPYIYKEQCLMENFRDYKKLLTLYKKMNMTKTEFPEVFSGKAKIC